MAEEVETKEEELDPNLEALVKLLDACEDWNVIIARSGSESEVSYGTAEFELSEVREAIAYIIRRDRAAAEKEALPDSAKAS